MGFNRVYQLLREEFDGIDARVLKAVAIEHSYDANEAFSVVLDEIIPYECTFKAPASAVLCTTPRNVPSIPGTTNKSVRSIPITTPSLTEKKSVDRKQLVDIVGEGLSVAGPSRTYDAFVYPGELANSRMSNHPAKDEYANGKIGVKSQVPKKGCSEICCSLNALVVKASDSQTDQCVSGIVKDLESDKKNLISAMESVLNILKDVEAKKQEAAAACKTDDIYVKLAGDVMKNRPTLINEVTAIESRLLNLLKDKDKSLTILDDMRRSLQVQLAQAEEEIEKGKLIKLQKKAQMTKEMRLHELAAEENLELQDLLKDYDEEVDMLQSELESISVGILMLKDEIDRDSHLRKPITHSASLNSSILSHESEDFTTSQVSKNFTKSEDSSDDLPSLKIHVSDSSFSSQESEDVNEVSVQESQYSESESKSAEHLAPFVSPLKRSSALSSSLSSDENDNTAQANVSDQEAFPVTPRRIILNPVQKTAVSHVSVHHEVPCKTNSPILTDVAAKLNNEATNACNDANDDDWDFCDHFESDA